MVLEGHYAKKQIFCQNQIIAWSHSSRFKSTINLVEKYAITYSNLLDYGCGDGTFLTMVSNLFSEAFGTDVSQEQIHNCQQRLSGETKLKFCLKTELDSQEYNSYFDIAVCMEVLEHCPPEQAEIKPIRLWKRLTRGHYQLPSKKVTTPALNTAFLNNYFLHFAGTAQYMPWVNTNITSWNDISL